MNFFFDIGANVGQTFDDFLLRTNEFDGWTVVCFEPSIRHLPGLIEKVQTVKDRFKVIVCPFAVAGSTGVSTLFEKDDPRGDSIYENLWQGGYVGNRSAGYQLSVARMRVDWAICALTNPDDNLVLKLDCEGAEYGILENLLQAPNELSRVSRLMVEFHTIDSDDGTSRAKELELEKEFIRLGKPWEIWPH